MRVARLLEIPLKAILDLVISEDMWYTKHSFYESLEYLDRRASLYSLDLFDLLTI